MDALAITLPKELSVDYLSSLSGVPEPSLRLLLCLISGYPAALFYRLFFLNPQHGKSVNASNSTALRNLYVLFTGFLVALFFCRWSTDILPSLISIVGTWAACKILGDMLKVPRFIVSLLIWVGNFGFLMFCYWKYASQDYDLNWLTPQSVLCLRLIGFGMDYYDGRKPASSVKKGDGIISESDRPLATTPSLLETLAYNYFYGAFLVGPQFPFVLYKKYLTMELFINAKSKKAFVPSSAWYTLRCLFLGVFYLALQQVGGSYFQSSYLVTSAFAKLSFGEKLLRMWLTGKFVLNKYLGVWIFNEGSCVLSGISFNGFDASGKSAKWDALSNIIPSVYEFPTCLNDYVVSFNINTNNWSKIYVFKRLRFMNSKILSAFGTLAFLALWHGYHAGYFMCFFLEFVDMEAERRLVALFKPLTTSLATASSSTLSKIFKSLLRIIIRLVSFSWATIALHYATVPFDLLHASKFLIALRELKFFGHYVILLAVVAEVALVVQKALGKKKKVENGVAKEEKETKKRK